MLNRKQSKEQSIAVIGGGIIGLSSALKLQLEGYQVTVFDPSGAGSQCSKGNAGHFATEQIFPLANPRLIPQLPKMLLSKKSPVSVRFQDLPKTAGWMLRFLSKAGKKSANHATKALIELNSRSLKSWEKLLAEVGLSHLIISQGSLLVFENEKLFEGYQSTLNAMKDGGVKWQIWNSEQLSERMPNLSSTVKVGVFFPDTSHTSEPYELCLEMKSSFLSLGGEWIEEPVENVEQKGKGNRIFTAERQYYFDKTVVATGAQSVPLIEKVTNIKVPLQAERGYHLMADKAEEILPIPVSSADRKFIMTPMKHGLRLAGTVEYAALDAPANMNRANMLKPLANGLLKSPISDKELAGNWMGNRPSLPDSLPVIDQNSDGRILFAFGHQHLGLTQAAITAELITQMANGEQTQLDLSPYRLTRF